MTGRVVLLVCCAGFFSLVAVVTRGITTSGENPSKPAHDRVNASVTAVIRNGLGQFRWVVTDATDYTPLEAQGRRVYQQSGCMYCHTQYVRPVSTDNRPWGPVSADTRRWGPAAELGEMAFDQPRLPGPGGIGPDLSREGLKYSDEWHLAHFWNPPMVTKFSLMGGFSGLFDAPAEPVAIVAAKPSGKTLAQTTVTQAIFSFSSKEVVKLTPNDQGLLFVPSTARGKYPLIWMPNKEFAGDRLQLVIETPAIEALIAYIQKLGMNRGRWREAFEPEAVEGSDISLPRSDDWIAHGKEVYERRCIACHGVQGNGNGWAATFLYKQRPRNFTLGVFKFRLDKGLLPTDADLLRTITRGVKGTAMPAWFELPIGDRLAVMQYVKYVLTADRSDPAKPDFYFLDEPPGPPMKIDTPPAPTAALISHGHDIWLQAKCWECHGRSGHGDGEKAAGLKDDWGFPIRPANLTLGRFKSGPGVADIFRTISTGLSGSPMPSFGDAFSVGDRWALATYILSLSAYIDPLTGEALQVCPADRKALEDALLPALVPEHAYALHKPTGPGCAAPSATRVAGR